MMNLFKTLSQSGSGTVLRNWLAQRITGVVISVFTVLVLAQVLIKKGPIGYDLWASIFSSQWMKVITFVVILSLAWHVLLGMKEIYMDYIKPVAVRLALKVFTVLWLVGCAGWAIQVLWRV